MAILTVDLDALGANYRYLRDASRPSECGAVVKCNAYGLGIEPVARRLAQEGCAHFFVATVEEGAELRAILATGSAVIHVFNGVYPGIEQRAIDCDLVPVLNCLAQIDCWAAAAARARRELPADIHIDTGMTRLGLSGADVERVAARTDLTRLRVEYLLTHLACADEPERATNQVQVQTFNRLRARLPEAKTCIGNSAAALFGSSLRGDLVRPGIALYGGNPFIDRPNPMREVVCLEGRILQVRDVTEPVAVGYGATCEVDPPARLAIVGVGYADGYPRALGNRGVAIVAGRRCPVVGRISMDLITIDVSNAPKEATQPGAYAHLIGGGIPLDEVAELAGTVSYEVLTRLGPRLQRVYQGDVTARRSAQHPPHPALCPTLVGERGNRAAHSAQAENAVPISPFPARGEGRVKES
jgi:alanine racemase